MAINREELKKYSRDDLESVIVNITNVIDRFRIIADLPNDDFFFTMNGKSYDARCLVNVWDMLDSRSICDYCDCKQKENNREIIDRI